VALQTRRDRRREQFVALEFRKCPGQVPPHKHVRDTVTIAVEGQIDNGPPGEAAIFGNLAAVGKALLLGLLRRLLLRGSPAATVSTATISAASGRRGRRQGGLRPKHLCEGLIGAHLIGISAANSDRTDQLILHHDG
jgi:hypothetical protein